MLEALLGNETIEKVLFFIFTFEEGRILVSQKKGNTRIFTFNPSYAFLDELKALLDKGKKMLPEEEIEKYYIKRKRPRKTGKP
ncbi:MAG: ArsR family transcriptional regulator [Elusimicrobiota bacterium]